MTKPDLSTVTLCAATSVNVAATIEALLRSSEQAKFARCLLFTHDRVPDLPDGIEVMPIAPLSSSADYSAFILGQLAGHIATSHCLIIQWDGFVIDAAQWDAAFLDFDYIGAPWPQFDDGADVGNGGFSLRSRRLLNACRDPAFHPGHPEDVAVCRTNRALLERHGLRFADRETARHFAFERTVPGAPTFGFHGVFNMIPIVGAEKFWEIYRSLDDPSTAFVDFWRLMRGLGEGQSPLARRARLAADRLAGLFSR
jgi:hypothetical protein